MSARMPPEFMNAISASPRLAGAVAASWASAITSPSVDSPEATAVRVRSPWIVPMTWFASGADAVTYWFTTAWTCGSSFVGSGCAEARVSGG